MITAKDIIVQYNSGGRIITALDSVSLDIARGEYVAILGPNGSGKSTFLKALCGLTDMTSGQVSIMSEPVMPGSFSEMLFGQVGVVFQEPEGQFVMRDVEAEIGSVLQNLGISREEQRNRFLQTVEQFGLLQILGQKPDKLSGGQMQIVNLACAVATGSQIILLDEPTTFLDQSWREAFLDILDKLHDKGLTILHITQYADEAARADKVCLFDCGKIVFYGKPGALFEDGNLVAKHHIAQPLSVQFKSIFGFDVTDFNMAASFAEDLNCDHRDAKKSRTRGNAIAEISRINFRYPKSDFQIEIGNLTFYSNEIVGLVGPTGSGKSTLAFLLSGLLKSDSGNIFLNNRLISEYKSSELRHNVGLSWQIADLALIGPTVEDDIKFGIEDRNFDPKGILALVGLGGHGERIVDTLSGGEKRKLSLAAILAAEPEMLILDEPSAFLDPGAQAELIGILREIASNRHSILIIGHDLQFISEFADRILGMKDGKIIIDMPSSEFFSSPDCLEQLGLPQNPIVEFRKILSAHGMALPDGTLNPLELGRHLKPVGAN